MRLSKISFLLAIFGIACAVGAIAFASGFGFSETNVVFIFVVLAAVIGGVLSAAVSIKYPRLELNNPVPSQWRRALMGVLSTCSAVIAIVFNDMVFAKGYGDIRSVTHVLFGAAVVLGMAAYLQFKFKVEMWIPIITCSLMSMLLSVAFLN